MPPVDKPKFKNTLPLIEIKVSLTYWFCGPFLSSIESLLIHLSLSPLQGLTSSHC